MNSAMSLLQLQANMLGVALTEEKLQKFALYLSLLLEWNKKINLTAIKDTEQIIIKHFADSLSLLQYMDIPKNAAVIDVGSGAGFPGIPLAIARSDIRLMLLDSLGKRMMFLQTVVQRLSIAAQTLHARAEEAGQKQQYREKYDIAVSRAVAALPVLAEYCLPLVKPGGVFAAMKGPQAHQELQQAKNAIALLSGAVKKEYTFELPGAGVRTLLLFEKIGTTEKKYPRNGAKIVKKPL